MNLEQELAELRAIRDDAPYGASHYHYYCGELNFFKWVEVDTYLKWSKKSQSWLDGFRPTQFIHSLISVNRQIELIEQLLFIASRVNIDNEGQQSFPCGYGKYDVEQTLKNAANLVLEQQK